MRDVEDFLSEVIPRQAGDRVTSRHDAVPRKALWAHDDPVTLFGAELSGRGWGEIESAFDRLAASLSGSQSCDYGVLGAGVSGDLGYVAAIERSVAASRGGDLHPLRAARHYGISP